MEELQYQFRHRTNYPEIFEITPSVVQRVALEKYLKHITDVSTIPNDNLMIAGGYLLEVFLGIPSNDVDVYMYSSKWHLWNSLNQDARYRTTRNTITIQTPAKDIQLIPIAEPGFDMYMLLASFDNTLSMAGYSPKTNKMYIHADILRFKLFGEAKGVIRRNMPHSRRDKYSDKYGKPFDELYADPNGVLSDDISSDEYALGLLQEYSLPEDTLPEDTYGSPETWTIVSSPIEVPTTWLDDAMEAVAIELRQATRTEEYQTLDGRVHTVIL